MRFLKTKLFALLTLMLCMGVFCVTASASDGGETLTVTAAWADGELLRINVTDAAGVSSALALRLSDYVSSAESKEYISIQAVDLAGNKSGVIEIKNPYYDPSAAPVVIITPNAEEQTEQPQSSQSAVPDGSSPAGGNRPFTPDGAGTVMDNVTDGDGKEFFTVGTEDGSVFYLIVDRQRNTDNVYLLNAVTEEDLMALAEKNGREITPPGNDGGTSAVTTPEQPGETQPQTSAPEPVTEPEAKPPAKNDTTMYIIIGAIVLAVGGAGYYFKIVKGKKNNSYPDDEEDDDDGDEYGYGDETDDPGEDAEDGGGEE
jgi:hypothetical protein